MSSSATLAGWTVNDPRLVFEPASHTYRLADRVLPSVTQVLQEARVADFSAPHFTDEVLERGSHIHKAILFDNEGTLDEGALDPTLLPYVEGWRRYLAETGATIEFWEQPITDPDLGFAGTLDGIVLTVDDRGREKRTLIDIKRALYPSAGPQTAAYRKCAYALYDRPVILHRAVVVLPGDGSYRVHPLLDHVTDEQVFLAALRIVNFRRSVYGDR